jgi:hypothetical protein
MHNRRNHDTSAHRPRNHTLYDTSILRNRFVFSSNSEGFKKFPDDGRLLQKHVGANIYNKGVVQISA